MNINFVNFAPFRQPYLTMFYAAVRQEGGTELKVLALKAIRAAIDQNLRQPPNNKP